MGEIVRTEKNNTRKLIMIAAVICSFFISFENVPEAAVMPVYERLMPVTANLNAPTAVALDKNECIFVAESVNNRLLVYSQNGRYMNTIAGLSRPISVAVDNSVRVFIGNKDRGNVEAYDSNYNFLFKLGTGDGEFSQPNDIAISGTGDIYVVDKGEDKVKIYNADGTYHSSLGSPGGGDGEFNNPVSVAIDEEAGELIVLDRQLTQDMFGNSIEGARIQIFDLSGVFKRSFSKYGNSIGEMFRPQHVAVDDQGRLYVTDSFHNVVLVYDRNGTYLGDIYDVDNPMRTPLGVTIGGSNRVYIASLSTGKVEMYGIDAYTHMEVRPLSLNFQGQEGAGIPAAESVEIINNGTGVLSWTARTNKSWIILSETAGTTQAGGITIMDVSVNQNGLAAETYTGTVSISSSTGATEVIDIVLEVLPKPVLSVTPSSLTFTSTNESYPSSQTLSIANAGAGTLDWTGSGDRSWIVIDRTSGTGPENITVSVDITSLNAGTHTGSVTISGQGALSSPAIIPVTLNMVELTGAINVTANVAGAMFTINGPQSFSGSGVSWTETEVMTGTYAIVYGEIDGYIAPSAESKTLYESETINFHGEYVIQGGGQQGNHRSIIVGAGPGEQNTGLVKVFKSDGTEAGVEFTAHGYPYGVNVSAGDINYDGEDEIITAPGPGADNPAEVKIYNRDGVELEHLAITAFQYKYGAHVASGDFNGDGEHEVLVGAGAGKDNPSEVRVYVYDSINNEMVDSGINLLAYSSGYGVQVAAGDIDNDGKDEIITSPGPGQDNAGVLRIWSVNSLSGIGQWDAEMIKEITVTDFHGYSVRVGCGDVNGDGYAEVITGAGPDPSGRDEIRIYDINGEKVSEFRGYVAKRYGVLVGSGDLDNDGVAEIVVGAGPGSRNSAVAKIFDAYGIEQERFKAMRSLYGVNVAVGMLGL